MKKILVLVLTTVLLTLGLTACGSSGPSKPKAVGVCINKKTHKRVSDTNCKVKSDTEGSFSPLFIWWYYLNTQIGKNYGAVPSIGQYVVGGSSTQPGSSVNLQKGGVAEDPEQDEQQQEKQQQNNEEQQQEENQDENDNPPEEEPVEEPVEEPAEDG